MERTKDKYGRGQKDEKEEPNKDSEWIEKMMKQMMMREERREKKDLPYPSNIINNLTLDGICKCIESGECKKIITMAGAGISKDPEATSRPEAKPRTWSPGLPDVEAPDSHPIYKTMKGDQEIKLPEGNLSAAFDIGYFRNKPEAFYKHAYPMLCPSLNENDFQLTSCHYLIRLFQDKGILLRHYTQNVDGLERKVGVKEELLVEAHGSFEKNYLCVRCDEKYSEDCVKDMIKRDKIPRCKKIIEKPGAPKGSVSSSSQAASSSSQAASSSNQAASSSSQAASSSSQAASSSSQAASSSSQAASSCTQPAGISEAANSSQQAAANECNGVIKPDIVFFGEELPSRFFDLCPEDVVNCDLLIIMGTSLTVQPFASLFERVSDHVPRLYINTEEPLCGEDLLSIIMGMEKQYHGFKFGETEKKSNKRDVFHKSDCVKACSEMITKLNWTKEEEELKKLIAPTTGAASSDVKSAMDTT